MKEEKIKIGVSTILLIISIIIMGYSLYKLNF